jgi:hypothetical protein
VDSSLGDGVVFQQSQRLLHCRECPVVIASGVSNLPESAPGCLDLMRLERLHVSTYVESTLVEAGGVDVRVDLPCVLGRGE